jgi:hypothetical protein
VTQDNLNVLQFPREDGGTNTFYCFHDLQDPVIGGQVTLDRNSVRDAIISLFSYTNEPDCQWLVTNYNDQSQLKEAAFYLLLY